jgi:hypothetical protein
MSEAKLSNLKQMQALGDTVSANIPETLETLHGRVVGISEHTFVTLQ